MKSRIAALAVFAALGVTACSKPAAAPVPEASSAAPASVATLPADPKLFLTALYAHYDGSQMNFSPFDDASAYFEPQLLALMDADTRSADEVGALDGDPICDCQDYQKLRADIAVTSVSDDAAQAEVKLRDIGNAKTKTITYKLARMRGGWRIHDIGTREVPSLRRLLINSSPKA